MIFNRFDGVQREILTNGFHFRIPWIQVPIVFDVNKKMFRFENTYKTKDSIELKIILNIEYKPNEANLRRLYLNIGPNYDNALLPSLAHEILKDFIVIIKI